MGKLFGGGSSTQRTVNEPWAAAQPALRQGLADGQNLYGQGGFRIDPYQGQRVAQYSPQTLGGIDALYATGNNPLTGATSDALLSNLNMDDTYRDMDLIRSRVSDDVKANLSGMFAGGAINSGMAGGYASSQMAEALAGVEYDQFNNAKSRQLAAIGLAPQTANMGRQDASAMLTAGGLLDSQNQANIDADMQLYYETESADMDALNRYSAFAQGFGGLGGTGSASGTTQASGASTLGTLAKTAGAILPFFSDRRLKENIEAVGTTDSGVTLYSFNYVFGGPAQIGVMSDEVPHAVIGQINGFDVVDYGRLA